MNKWLVGFDIRVNPERYAGRRWDKPRRELHLLRPELKAPLTVDGLAWPSVFHAEGVQPGDSPIEIDRWDPAGNPWLDLEALKRSYAAHRALARGGIVVGIELLSEREADGDYLMYLQDGVPCGLSLDPTNPARLPEGSALLGYDVADAARISGLVNCGYNEQELLALRPTWGARLNGFGLFDALDDAIAFREVTDARVPEHAPFWIYALWQLPM